MILLIAMALFACKKSNDLKNSWIIDDGVEFSVFNADNEDLLDPETANHLNTSEIKLFYLVDGKMEEVYNPMYQFPRNFMIYKHEHEYRIAINLNFTADTCITYIQWNPYDVDTLEATYRKRTDDLVQISKVWLNGTQIWDWTTKENAYYKITK